MNEIFLHLTRNDIEEILHHSHWIAAKNGAQSRFVNQKYPGFTFAELMKLLIDNRCVVKSRSKGRQVAHFSGWQVRSRLKQVRIPVAT